jgi:hypothetical protein
MSARPHDSQSLAADRTREPASAARRAPGISRPESRRASPSRPLLIGITHERPRCPCAPRSRVAHDCAAGGSQPAREPVNLAGRASLDGLARSPITTISKTRPNVHDHRISSRPLAGVWRSGSWSVLTGFWSRKTSPPRHPPSSAPTPVKDMELKGGLVAHRLLKRGGTPRDPLRSAG